MNCPKCGKEMQIGEMAANARGERCFWAPKSFFNKHVLNPTTHFKKTIEKEGGLVVDIHNRVVANPTVGYACKECRVVLIDCD